MHKYFCNFSNIQLIHKCISPKTCWQCDHDCISIIFLSWFIFFLLLSIMFMRCPHMIVFFTQYTNLLKAHLIIYNLNWQSHFMDHVSYSNNFLYSFYFSSLLHPNNNVIFLLFSPWSNLVIIKIKTNNGFSFQTHFNRSSRTL